MSDPPSSRFRNLHSGFFVLSNPWDVGSAVMLERMGFRALATTSSGYAMSLGRSDGEVGPDELVNHTTELTQAVGLPINVDAERLFADDLGGVSANVERLAGAGAAGGAIARLACDAAEETARALPDEEREATAAGRWNDESES